MIIQKLIKAKYAINSKNAILINAILISRNSINAINAIIPINEKLINAINPINAINEKSNNAINLYR